MYIYDDGSCGTGCSLVVLVAPMDKLTAPGAIPATTIPQSSRFWGVSWGLCLDKQFGVSQDQLPWVSLNLGTACDSGLIVFYRKSFY